MGEVWIFSGTTQSTKYFHDFPWQTLNFNDSPGLENEILKFHDFPGFQWPIQPLFECVDEVLKCDLHVKVLRRHFLHACTWEWKGWNGWQTYLRCCDSLLRAGSSEKIWFLKAIPAWLKNKKSVKKCVCVCFLIKQQLECAAQFK